MSDPRTAWTILAPLIAALVAAALLAAAAVRRLPPRSVPWLRLLALVTGAAGLLVEGVLLVVAQGEAAIPTVGVTAAINDEARLVLLAANVAIFCAMLFVWGGSESAPYAPRHDLAPVAALVTSSMAAGAALLTDGAAAILCLFVAALAASALAVSAPRGDVPPVPAPADAATESADDRETRARLARRVASGLKHAGLALLGTGLLMSGVLLASRYAFNLEDRGLLQLGLGLMAAGLLVRSGSMPFAAAWADAVEAAPGAAVLMLGAGVPATLVSVALMLDSIEAVPNGVSGAAWLGVLGALLAGVRALGAVVQARRAGGLDPEGLEAAFVAVRARSTLAGMTVALAAGWAVFGLLSGWPGGREGAILVAANIAIAAPLLVLGSRTTTGDGAGLPEPVARLARYGAAASLVGLPPLGGFPGTVLIAQAGANAGGLWLIGLVLGSALVGAAWLAAAGSSAPLRPEPVVWRARFAGPSLMLVLLLAALQLALFFFAPFSGAQ
ncbi:MAG TPA: hypothetical protein VFR15_09060 [Chloroflexia bacterium]|nr:hypothetical protein [Chloroflexia bacterium]